MIVRAFCWYISKFTKYVGPKLLGLHSTVYEEVRCARARLKVHDATEISTEVGVYFSVHPLNDKIL